jgi:hypothetical protein
LGEFVGVFWIFHWKKEKRINKCLKKKSKRRKSVEKHAYLYDDKKSFVVMIQPTIHT